MIFALLLDAAADVIYAAACGVSSPCRHADAAMLPRCHDAAYFLPMMPLPMPRRYATHLFSYAPPAHADIDDIDDVTPPAPMMPPAQRFA